MPDLAPDQVPEGWSRIASVYERAFETLTAQFSREAVRLLDIGAGDRVLDVAAGTGSFSLAAVDAGAEVLATDFAPGMLARLETRIAEAGLLNISTEVMDGQALTVADGVFDASASVFGLIFFPDIDQGISELHRVLRTDGRAAVVCWGPPETSDLMSLLLQAVMQADPDFRPPPEPPVWARMTGAEMLDSAMTRAGFKEVAVTVMDGTLPVSSPAQFWHDFTAAAPPLALLFDQLGTDKTALAGEAFVKLLADRAVDNQIILHAEGCIGIGRAG